MPIPIMIPKATISMEEAEIVAWHKQEGDHVAKNEALFDMETDKVLVEVPSPMDGVLLRIEVRNGVARLEEPIGWIGESGERIPERTETYAPIVAAPLAPQVPQDSGTVPASPAARRRARELGVNLAHVKGTGPGGRVTETDVERAGGSQ